MSYMKLATMTLVVTSVSAVALVGCGGKSETSTAQKMQTNTPTDSTGALPSLQAELDARRNAFEQNAPEDVRKLYDSAIGDLRTSGIIASMVHVGDTAPDFTLPSVGGDSVHLYEKLKSGPVVLAWYRGGWCPYCNLELRALNDAMPQIDEAGGALIAISPQIPDSSSATEARDSLHFLVVSDAGNRIARKYGIVYKLPEKLVESYNQHFDLTAYNGDSSYTLPLPATFVIDTNRVVRYAFANVDYRVRAEPALVVAKVRGLTSPGS